MIDGPANQPELEDFFVGSQSLNAENTADDFGVNYYESNNFGDLRTTLAEFLESGAGPAILEIITDPQTNTKVFNSYKTTIQKVL